MTVRRDSEEFFYVSPAEVADAVRIVLTHRPPYNHTSEVEEGVVFKTNVRPIAWMNGTQMVIKLQAQYDGTRVTAETKSQWYTMGDVFDFYNRYLREFFCALRLELQSRALYKLGVKI